VASRVFKNAYQTTSQFSRGIVLALDMAHQSAGSQHLYLSDSLSSLKSLQNHDLSHPLNAEILFCVHGLLSSGTSVVFMWVSSYVGMAGNMAVDIAALYTPTSV